MEPENIHSVPPEELLNEVAQRQMKEIWVMSGGTLNMFFASILLRNGKCFSRDFSFCQGLKSPATSRRVRAERYKYSGLEPIRIPRAAIAVLFDLSRGVADNRVFVGIQKTRLSFPQEGDGARRRRR